jgi:Tol biopolymer transport system component
MPLEAGTRIGPYDVVAPLGAGGMGEVYRARDTRLGRDVALKTLHASFAGRPDRLQRFEQEARSTGLLNHPNILAVYDVGDHAGTPYVVSELLEGETLRERIGGTPLPVRKAVDYASQVAKGLAAAHDKGIVHRDLKPENVFVTRDGRVKILDFGLAKLLDQAPDVHGESETRDKPPTDAGTVLGTVGYMSPEQVRAKPVDHRSDIFSFGAVFYEMLSGQRAFRGNSAVETMNAILKEDPPALSETARNLPPALERIVAHCLEKNPEERFQSARDIAFDLEQLSGSSATTAPHAARRRLPWRWAAAVAAALACLAVGYRLGQRGADPPVVSFTAVTFQYGWVQEARFGPDGKQVLYDALWPGGGLDVYVTQPGTPESRGLNLKAELTAVSRSGELLIERPGDILAQVPMGGGAPRDLDAGIRAADWGPDGTSIAVVRLAGGRPQLEYPMGNVLVQAAGMRFPRVSPSGKLVAFSDHPFANDYRGDVAVVDLQGRKTTLSANWADIRGLAWSADGKEVWFSATKSGAENSLWAVSLEGEARRVFRAPGSLALHDMAPDGRALLTVQRRRPLIYGLAPGETKERNLSWMDYGNVADLSADGRTLLFSEEGEAGGAEYVAYVRGMDGSLPVRLGKGVAMALSADGKQALVVDMAVPMQASVIPTGIGSPRKLPRGKVTQIHGAVFFPDGLSVVLAANERERPRRLFVQDLSGGDPRPITEEGVSGMPGMAVTPDGSHVATWDPDGSPALYPLDGGAPRPIKGAVRGDAPQRFSADGRFLFVRATADEAVLHRIDMERGVREPWKVLAREGGNPAAFVTSVALSADGSAYAYTYRDDTSTLYVAEGLR